MHHTKGVSDDSGQGKGHLQSAQLRDRILVKSFVLPENSELSIRSGTIRTRIYGSELSSSGSNKHYIRHPHGCGSCSKSFGSKDALRRHRFEKHSY